MVKNVIISLNLSWPCQVTCFSSNNCPGNTDLIYSDMKINVKHQLQHHIWEAWNKHVTSAINE